jgi:hypothetical protein
LRSSLYFVFSFALWITLCVVSSAAAELCPESAQTFWKAFRVKALKKNPPLLLKYVQFPFEVRGSLDSSGKKELNEKEFVSSYPLFLSTDPGVSPEPTTMEVFVKQTVRIPKTACAEAGTEFRIGTWSFNLTPEGWRFVRAFVED